MLASSGCKLDKFQVMITGLEIEAEEMWPCKSEIRLLIILKYVVTLATSLLCFSEGQFKLLSIDVTLEVLV